MFLQILLSLGSIFIHDIVPKIGEILFINDEHHLGLIPSFKGRKFDSRNYVLENIPDEFDVRVNWPECEEITRNVRNQGYCESSYAFTTVSTISDRICIASKGKIKVNISAEDLLLCCDFCGNYTNGGSLKSSFEYWVKKGLVSGGDHGDKNTCKPFEISKCVKNIYQDEKCNRSCTNGADYKKDLYFGSEFYQISNSIKAIQTEIILNGPVAASLIIYNDFKKQAKNEVYQKSDKAEFKGHHSVKIIGWGEKNNVPYWLVVNSWSSDWNDKGLFKILRGKNECGIESYIITGKPKLLF